MTVTLVALGGLGEFGANALLVEGPGGSRILIDAGVAFSDLEPFGVDFERPDFASLPGAAPEALICTHAHDDHGKAVSAAIEAFPDIRVIATKETLARLDIRSCRTVETIEGSTEARVGPWSVDVLPVSHSIPGAILVRMRSQSGTMVMATDFRLGPPALGVATDGETLSRWGDESVDLLLLDSTNSLVVAPPPAEDVVAAELVEVVATARGAVVAATFASHVGRCRQLARAAVAAGRVAIPLGRGVVEALRVQTVAGGLGLEPGTFRPAGRLAELPHDKVVVIATGSQGEEGSALARLAVDRVPGFRLEPGDRVVHAARIIPGRERRLAALFDHCVRRGAEVVTATEAPIHASGHPHRAELEETIRRLRPNWVIPVHGGRRQLEATAALARGLGCGALVIENGMEVRWGIDGIEPTGQHRGVGRVLVDGQTNQAVDTVDVRTRCKMARSGVIVAILRVPTCGRASPCSVQLFAVGLVLAKADLDEMRVDLDEAVARRLPELGDHDVLRSTMTRWLRRELPRRTGRHAAVAVVVVEN